LNQNKYVSRAGQKLCWALQEFDLSVKDKLCLDLGCSTGGFVDCLLQNGAAHVIAVDTGYGVLDWNLRNDDRVVVMERTNALHVKLEELKMEQLKSKKHVIEFVSIDVGWTPQKFVLRNVLNLIKGGIISQEADIVSLVKPHYELQHHEMSAKFLKKGKLDPSKVGELVETVYKDIEDLGFNIQDTSKSPIKGKKGGNIEFLFWSKCIEK
jgi:23S rRNA (cytidine1920-2'-O)/16S rRNA (cytidine1409-2'-O)-methyltransferase